MFIRESPCGADGEVVTADHIAEGGGGGIDCGSHIAVIDFVFGGDAADSDLADGNVCRGGRLAVGFDNVVVCVRAAKRQRAEGDGLAGGNVLIGEFACGADGKIIIRNHVAEHGVGGVECGSGIAVIDFIRCGDAADGDFTSRDVRRGGRLAVGFDDVVCRIRAAKRQSAEGDSLIGGNFLIGELACGADGKIIVRNHIAEHGVGGVECGSNITVIDFICRRNAADGDFTSRDVRRSGGLISGGGEFVIAQIRTAEHQIADGDSLAGRHLLIGKCSGGGDGQGVAGDDTGEHSVGGVECGSGIAVINLVFCGDAADRHNRLVDASAPCGVGDGSERIVAVRIPRRGGVGTGMSEGGIVSAGGIAGPGHIDIHRIAGEDAGGGDHGFDHIRLRCTVVGSGGAAVVGPLDSAIDGLPADDHFRSGFHAGCQVVKGNTVAVFRDQDVVAVEDECISQRGGGVIDSGGPESGGTDGVTACVVITCRAHITGAVEIRQDREFQLDREIIGSVRAGGGLGEDELGSGGVIAVSAHRLCIDGHIECRAFHDFDRNAFRSDAVIAVGAVKLITYGIGSFGQGGEIHHIAVAVFQEELKCGEIGGFVTGNSGIEDG